jgi:hypothetical protein
MSLYRQVNTKSKSRNLGLADNVCCLSFMRVPTLVMTFKKITASLRNCDFQRGLGMRV